MIYRVEIDWDKDESDWMTDSAMYRAIRELIRSRFLGGEVVDVTIEEDDE